jgi:hypothetical protein
MPDIAPRSGAAFLLGESQTLTVIDIEGEQVADLLAFDADDVREVLSSGRTLDYQSKIWLTTGDTLWSNRSNKMLEIVRDDVGRHDFLLTPCSADTFRIIYGDEAPHCGCFGNLAALWRLAGHDPGGVQLFHERADRCRNRRAIGAAALLQSRRRDRVSGASRPDHRPDCMLRAAIEQLCVQADPLRDRVKRACVAARVG